MIDCVTTTGGGGGGGGLGRKRANGRRMLVTGRLGLLDDTSSDEMQSFEGLKVFIGPRNTKMSILCLSVYNSVH